MAFKIPKVVALKTLLDSYGREDNIGVGNEPDMLDRELKEEQKRKKKGD
jgi:hypothetical protein